jgi:type II secretory pathway pseudopilin PulG
MNERMIGMLLVSVLLVGIVILVAILVTLRSSRRAEELGEDRYELLRDQQEWLELLREERKMLTEKLEQESKERRQLRKT